MNLALDPRFQIGRGKIKLLFYFFNPTIIVIFTYNLKQNNMYSLKCKYYDKSFDTLDELLNNILESGMDPSYEVTLDGKGIGEMAQELIVE